MVSKFSFKSEPQESPLSKRTYARLDTKVKISYKRIEKSIKPVAELVQFHDREAKLEQYSTIKDISAGGMLFFSDKRISLNSIFSSS